VKRTRLGPGQAALKRGSTFKTRQSPLPRRTGPTKRRRRHPSVPEFWKALTAGQPCACGCGRPAVHGHHVIYAQVLRREGAPLYSRPNHMPVAAECHADHHNAVRRLPLPAGHPVWAFADSIGLRWWLERTYGAS
jgi:hypothetical protein